MVCSKEPPKIEELRRSNQLHFYRAKQKNSCVTFIQPNLNFSILKRIPKLKTQIQLEYIQGTLTIFAINAVNKMEKQGKLSLKT